MITIKVASKKLIKPHTPTPQNLSNYKLSFLDEFGPGMAVGVLLFYSESKKNRGEFEESLAKTLVQFYPLAGRYNRRYHYVHCSDEGVEFIEAEALNVELNDIVVEKDVEQLSGFMPYMNHKLIDESIDPVLSIQMTELKCGGLVVGISVSHRVFDASSLGIFIAAWSSNSRTNSSSIKPIFDCWKMFPSKNQINDNDVLDIDGFETPKPVVKVFSFNKDTITNLKSKWGISRVRAVSALLVEVFLKLDGAKHGGKSRPFLAMQAVDIRGRTNPPLSRYSCGNLVLSAPKEFTIKTREIEIKDVVDHLGNALDKAIADCTKILSMDENSLYDIVVKPLPDALRRFSSGEANLFGITDWSKLGLYKADFGSGKPIWTGIAVFPTTNGVVLMDNKEGDGIEAWVHLDKNDMTFFEQDEIIRNLN